MRLLTKRIASGLITWARQGAGEVLSLPSSPSPPPPGSPNPPHLLGIADDQEANDGDRRDVSRNLEDTLVAEQTAAGLEGRRAGVGVCAQFGKGLGKRGGGGGGGDPGGDGTRAPKA